MVGRPLESFAGDCHRASLALVRSGVFGRTRVARGGTSGVPFQHSWVVLGWDCYDPAAEILDPTLWAYLGEPPQIWEGCADERPHVPHGAGSIWDYGRPRHAVDKPIELGCDNLSSAAADFLALLGPLDYRGWSVLAHAPVGDWPAGEIITAMCQHPKLRMIPPINIVGMVTDLNPLSLYW